MRIIHEKKEIHLCNPSIEELAEAIEKIRSRSVFDDYKIMIDGIDKNPIDERKIFLSE